MIAFLTLLLGLISGPYPIEVTVSGPVSRVEISLDGKVVRGIAGPPWRTDINFGEALVPHELVARALDEKGMEIARAEQRINLPRAPAEVEIVLEGVEDGTPTAARLNWQSVDDAAPRSIELSFDGKPLVIDTQRRASLPRYDAKVVHIMSAEVDFGSGVAGRREVVFGGEYGSSISTELTALLVRAPQRGVTLSPGSLAGRFAVFGKAVDVVAIEQGPGRVIVVQVPNPTELSQRWLPFNQGLEVKGELRAEEVMGGASAGARRNALTEMLLGSDIAMHLLSPRARGFGGRGVAADLFSLSPALGGGGGGLLRHLTQSGISSIVGRGTPGQLRTADAVAVAGLQAAAEDRRRAVVLVLGEKETDGSRYTIETVRRYLAAIRVPLYVWSPYGAKSPSALAWSGAEDVSTLPKLHQAFSRLQADLTTQRVVWVEGRYLPQAIQLSPGTGGVELVLPQDPGASEPRAAR